MNLDTNVFKKAQVRAKLEEVGEQSSIYYLVADRMIEQGKDVETVFRAYKDYKNRQEGTNL